MSNRYGFHRDELYFIESAKHLTEGYIDDPPLTAAIGWLLRRLLGELFDRGARHGAPT